MSPEQTGRMNHSVDYRTDLYSLGAVFYQMLTGAAPFAADQRLQLIHQIIAQTPPPPSHAREGLPKVVDEIVLKLLAKAPERRYQSAAGLLRDLVACRDLLRPDGGLDDFEIARADVPNRFQLPERLYGREAETEAILTAFGRALAERAPTLLLVSGEPGVGKSSLVHEVHKPIVAASGYFIAGKFDQMNRGQPLGSLIAALRDLVRQALSEPEARLRRLRARIEEALGATAQVVVDAVPELERLIGPQRPAPDLPPLESQNRFRQAFRAFVQAFAQPEHPLCLLLDDMQWADAATLEWLETAMLDRGLGALLIIAAYRDAETPPSHPFSLMIERLARAAPIARVRLAPLPLAVTRRIVADALSRDDEAARALAEIVQAKTLGNPFFVNQLLRALYLDGAIVYSSTAGAWVCDLDRIRAADITENVVDFLTARLRELEPATRGALEVAACVGASFDLDTLATAAQAMPEAISDALKEALAFGLIDAVGQAETGRLRYRFQHDRVQQAAYQLMDGADAKRVRLGVGRRLLAACAAPETDARLFEILQHLNLARDLIEAPAERLALARLNLAASVRARRSTAYGPAREFAALGAALTPAGAPGRLPFELALEGAECAHLDGDDAAAERGFEEALSRAADDFERAEVYERQIQFHTNRARFDRAFATGVTAAGMLGARLPRKFSPPLLIRDHLRIGRLIGGRKPMALVDRPDLADARLRLALRFMALVGKSSYQLSPQLCILICARIVYLSLRHGYTEDTTIGYLAYGVIFRGGVLGNHRIGDEFGQLTLALVDRYRHERVRAEATFVYGYFANSWVRGLADSERLFARAYQSGVEVGDYFHASCACSGVAENMLLRGADLASVRETCDRFEEFLRRVHTNDNVGTMQAIRQTVANLGGRTQGPDSFSDAGFDEAAFVASLPAYGSAHFAHMYWVDKLLTLVLWGRLEAAIAVAAASAKLLKDSPGMQHAAEHHFFVGLLDARRGRRLGVWRAARRLRKWAQGSPTTFAHKQYLLEAEAQRLLGRLDGAAALYDRAIASAQAAGYRHIAALAHQYAGELHLRRGARGAAAHHLREAALGYRRWGATGLAEDVKSRHADLIGDLVLEADAEGRRGAAAADSLDLETVLSAAQAISGEVQLNQLFARLMTLLRQNAGAERAALLLLRDGAMEARAAIDEQGEVSLLAAPLESYGEIAHAIVNYVVRSEEPLILEDAASEPRFERDPHVAGRKLRSVLCAPLHYLGELSGVLYLENNLAVGAFTEGRIEILKLLSGQIGVSIANAELYERLEEKVRLRTAQLESRNRFISRTFGRYLSDEIVELLLQSAGDGGLSGEKRRVTLLFSDLRGFTTLAEGLKPEEVVALMNTYLGVMTEVLGAHQATTIDFVGDAIIAVFGAPKSFGDDAARGVACAIDMQRAMGKVNALNAAAGYPALGMGIGLHTGEVIVGSVGSEKRAKYTVLGAHVNLAARIEGYSLAGDVLISETTRAAISAPLEIAAEATVEPKGVAAPIVISYVRGIGGRYDLRLPEAGGAWVALAAPVTVAYALVEHKQVRGEMVEAQLVALSEREAELIGPAPDALADVRLRVVAAGETVFIYAKAPPPAAGLAAGRFRLVFTAINDQARATLDSLATGARAA